MWGSWQTKPLLQQIWLVNPVKNHPFCLSGEKVAQRGLSSFNLQYFFLALASNLNML